MMAPAEPSHTKLWYLKRINLFSGLNPEELEEVRQLAFVQGIKKGQMIYMPGEPGCTIYFLKQGHVKISRLTSQGKEAIVELLGPRATPVRTLMARFVPETISTRTRAWRSTQTTGQ